MSIQYFYQKNHQSFPLKLLFFKFFAPLSPSKVLHNLQEIEPMLRLPHSSLATFQKYLDLPQYAKCCIVPLNHTWANEIKMTMFYQL